MRSNPIIRKLIMNEDDNKLGDAIRMGKEEGMQDFTESLRQLVVAEKIDRATAFEFAPERRSPENGPQGDFAQPTWYSLRSRRSKLVGRSPALSDSLDESRPGETRPPRSNERPAMIRPRLALAASATFALLTLGVASGALAAGLGDLILFAQGLDLKALMPGRPGTGGRGSTSTCSSSSLSSAST